MTLVDRDCARIQACDRDWARFSCAAIAKPMVLNELPLVPEVHYQLGQVAKRNVIAVGGCIPLRVFAQTAPVQKKGNMPQKFLQGSMVMRFCIIGLSVIALTGMQGFAQNAAIGDGSSVLIGTVTDTNDDVLEGAEVTIQGPASSDLQTFRTGDNGFFQFADLKAGTPYQVKVQAKGFANWTSQEIVLGPGQHMILSGCKLRIDEARTSVDVTYSPVQVATEQVEIEEKQRVFGFIPNFYVVYDPDPAPLTTKLKFKLAWRVVRDPMTTAGIAFLAGVEQAGNTPDYEQGASGYGKRFGANAADGFTDIMIGGAILPSLLHQDPRYFYQGTGTVKSRILHAVSGPFICRSDSGRRQPNFSSLGGDLASSALSNLYYPSSNRGAGLVFGNFAIGTAERVVATLSQEFLLRKLTSIGRTPK